MSQLAPVGQIITPTHEVHGFQQPHTGEGVHGFHFSDGTQYSALTSLVSGEVIWDQVVVPAGDVPIPTPYSDVFRSLEFAVLFDRMVQAADENDTPDVYDVVDLIAEVTGAE